jgi:hypothetical protein
LITARFHTASVTLVFFSLDNRTAMLFLHAQDAQDRVFAGSENAQFCRSAAPSLSAAQRDLETNAVETWSKQTLPH